MDWQISTNKTNQLTYGAVVQDWSFPRPSNALGVNQIHLQPAPRLCSTIPTPARRMRSPGMCPFPRSQDNFSWTLGRHNLSLGGTFKWIHTNENTVLNYNSYGLGLGGQVQGLDSSVRTGRPAKLPAPPRR